MGSPDGDDVAEKLREMNKRYDELNKKYVEILKAEKHHRETIKELQETNRSHESDKESMLAEYKEETKDLQEEVSELKNRLRTSNMKLADADRELGLARSKLDECTETRDKYETFLDDNDIDKITGISTVTVRGDPSTKAMQAVVKALEATAKRLHDKKPIELPKFKGNKGDKPEQHALSCEDYFQYHDIGDNEAEKCKTFKYTLEGKAREWLEDIEIPATWTKLRQMFTTHFSTQGRSLKHLHERWRSFKFDPDTMEIDAYLTDVKQTAKQLEYGERAVVDLLKSSMPDALYALLFEKDDLKTIVKMLKDFYAKKPDEASPSTASTSVASPFSAAKAVPHSKKSVEFEAMSIQDMQNKITELQDNFTSLNTGYNSGYNSGYNRRKAYKPLVSRGMRGSNRGYRGRDRSHSRDRRPRYNTSFRGRRNRSDSRHRGKSPGRRDRSESRDRYRKFDKSPTKRKPKSASKPVNKDEQRCFECHEIGHWAHECPNKSQSDSNFLGDNSFIFKNEPQTTSMELEEFQNIHDMFLFGEPNENADAMVAKAISEDEWTDSDEEDPDDKYSFNGFKLVDLNSK